ncbi:MAG TPA: peptide ABC transporter substrate-binding protein [Chloroflexia bacterium]|nr:peptide ABC transporter substrate-binding protein [Chloroflexia bacterium]
MHRKAPHRAWSYPRPLRGILVVLILMLLLSGCWPLPQDDAATPPGATATPLSSGPGLPPTEGAVNIAIGRGEPPTLDPALATDPYSLSIIRQLYSGLLAFDADLKVVPDIASAMPSVSPDGKTYTFPLRRGVRFTNGQEVTSADFKYSIERASDPRLAGPLAPTTLPAATYLGDIVGMKEKLAGTAKDVQGVVAPDPYTLVVTIDAPKSYFLSKFATGPTFAVQRSNVESGEAWTEEPRGTGPYKLQKWERNSYMTLARNTDYYGGVPEVPIVNIWMGRDNTNGIAEYSREGGLDVMAVGVEEIEEVSDRNNPLSRELRATTGLSTTYLGFNIRQKPFDDPKVREAIARAIDRQKVARGLFQSRVQQANSFVLPGVAGYKSPGTGELFNVAHARQLLAESTYKEAGNIPSLQLFTSGDSAGPLLSQALSQTLGLDIEVREIEWADYVSGLERGDYGMFISQTSMAYPDPEAVLEALFRSSSPANLTGYQNDDVDAILNAAALESDSARRLSAYTEVEARAMSEYAALPLFHPVSYTLVSPRLRGLSLTPVGMLSLRYLKAGER